MDIGLTILTGGLERAFCRDLYILTVIFVFLLQLPRTILDLVSLYEITFPHAHSDGTFEHKCNLLKWNFNDVLQIHNNQVAIFLLYNYIFTIATVFSKYILYFEKYTKNKIECRVIILATAYSGGAWKCMLV